MSSPTRVAFGLRSYATDSESGSWSGSELSGFPTDSDAESLSADFHVEADLPGFDVGSLDSGITPKQSAAPQTTKRDSHTELSPAAKKTWSEIDEQARKQEKDKPRVKLVKEAPRGHTCPAKNSNRRIDPRTPSCSDRSENWRSKSYPRQRSERRRSGKRRPRSDPPLKGAVERPYTLPSGPITVLLRRTTEAQEPADAEKVKLPGTSELEHLGFVDHPSLASSQESKENDQGSCGGSVAGNARVVTTRFGEGYLVENPSSEKCFPNADTPSSNGSEMKVARNAAMTAMAGLSMGGKEGRDSDLRSCEPLTASAETYDRSLGGQYKRPSQRRPSKRSKEPFIKAGMYSDRRGSRPRHNVFIGRRPKLETRHVREDDFLLGE